MKLTVLLQVSKTFQQNQKMDAVLLSRQAQPELPPDCVCLWQVPQSDVTLGVYAAQHTPGCLPCLLLLGNTQKARNARAAKISTCW